MFWGHLQHKLKIKWNGIQRSVKDSQRENNTSSAAAAASLYGSNVMIIHQRQCEQNLYPEEKIKYKHDKIRYKYKNKNNEHTKIITWSPEITSKACFIIIHNKNTLKHALLSSPVLMFPHKHWTDIVKTGSRSKHGSEWDISTQSGLLKGHRDTHTTHKQTQFI